MTELPKIALGVTEDRGSILLVRRRNKELKDDQELSWVFPGGKLEPGESPEEACIRETLEEANVVTNPVTTIYEGPHPNFPVYVYYLGCTAIVDMGIEIEDPAISGKIWVPKLEVARYVTSTIHPVVREYLGT